MEKILFDKIKLCYFDTNICMFLVLSSKQNTKNDTGFPIIP